MDKLAISSESAGEFQQETTSLVTQAEASLGNTLFSTQKKIARFQQLAGYISPIEKQAAEARKAIGASAISAFGTILDQKLTNTGFRGVAQAAKILQAESSMMKASRFMDNYSSFKYKGFANLVNKDWRNISESIQSDLLWKQQLVDTHSISGLVKNIARSKSQQLSGFMSSITNHIAEMQKSIKANTFTQNAAFDVISRTSYIAKMQDLETAIARASRFADRLSIGGNSRFADLANQGILADTFVSRIREASKILDGTIQFAPAWSPGLEAIVNQSFAPTRLTNLESLVSSDNYSVSTTSEVDQSFVLRKREIILTAVLGAIFKEVLEELSAILALVINDPFARGITLIALSGLIVTSYFLFLEFRSGGRD